MGLVIIYREKDMKICDWILFLKLYYKYFLICFVYLVKIVVMVLVNLWGDLRIDGI